MLISMGSDIVTVDRQVAPGAVFDDVIDQDEVIARLVAAVAATHDDPQVPAAAMSHAWLFTGPPGSGRSVAARAFAAALQCADRGCGTCRSCRTVRAGTHADVRVIVPDGLTISVKDMRQVVQLAARRPATGRRQIVLIEDADRLTESAANALLKAVEEPPEHTVFLLCAPSTHPDDVPITIQSRCRLVLLRTPSPQAIARVLVRRDGLDEQAASWAAGISAGHVGRARHLATDEQTRSLRRSVVELPQRLTSLRAAFTAAADLLATAKGEAKDIAETHDAVEMEQLKTSLGAGGTGKGVVGAMRGGAGALKDLERRQKSRSVRTERDVLDRALADLSGVYRDVLVCAMSGLSPHRAQLISPDVAEPSAELAATLGSAGALTCLDAVLKCRSELERNVKPQVAVENLMVQLAFVGRYT